LGLSSPHSITKIPNNHRQISKANSGMGIG
jgi:hypothetical protein